jgi:hypothetical protein
VRLRRKTFLTPHSHGLIGIKPFSHLNYLLSFPNTCTFHHIRSMANVNNNPAPIMSLAVEASTWEERVKDARRRGDVETALTVAATAADTIERRLNVTRNDNNNWEGEEREALKTVKRITFNAAADAWPGWQQSSDKPAQVVMASDTLITAKALAQRSADWVHKLQLGAIQEGTGIWLVGAFDLAMGDFDEALTRFSIALQQFQAAPAPGLALLTKGYAVMTEGLRAGRSRDNIAKDLEEVYSQISSAGFEVGQEWIEQLRSALQAFTK